MHDYVYIYIYTYIYLSKGKMGMRTHSQYDPYLIIGQVVNRKYWANAGSNIPRTKTDKGETEITCQITIYFVVFRLIYS